MTNSSLRISDFARGGVRDIASLLLDDKGRLKVVPARVLSETTPEERLTFGIQHGLYSLPTVELVEYLHKRIAGRTAIEVGAGHGMLAQALGIPATDNRQQESAALQNYYQQLGQATVPYGNHVEQLDAQDALQRYSPQVVIACWLTHRYDPARHAAGGSQTGVDEAAIIAGCEEYIFIGNELTHAGKPIWGLPHEVVYPVWVFSRAVNGSREFIASWRRA